MRLVLKAVVIAVALNGCAAKVMTATARTVVLKNAYPQHADKNQALADTECSRHGRYALMVPDYQLDGNVTYACVE